MRNTASNCRGPCWYKVEHIRRNPTNRNHRLIGEKFWVLQLLLVRSEKSPSQARIAGCVFTNWICVICNCKARTIADYLKYRQNYLRLSKYRTANTRGIQSIRNRHLYEKNLGFCNCGWLDCTSHFASSKLHGSYDPIAYA